MSIQPLSNFDYTILDPDYKFTAESLHDEIIGYISTLYRHYKSERSYIENIWLSAWASYLNTPQSEDYLRNEITRIVGSVKNDWRHRINTGKSFEVIETIHSYLMQAFFPNRNWLELEAYEPNLEEIARILRYYILRKLRDWKFRPQFASFLRQKLITGTSVMAVPWSDNAQIKFECLDNFDCYFNPTADCIDDSPFIRRVKKTRADVIRGIKDGFYTSNVSPFDIVSVSNKAGVDSVEYDHGGVTLNQFRGITISPYSMTDKLNILEFWGDIDLPFIQIKNVIVSMIGGHLLRFVPNTYKCGKPFVVGSYIPVVRQGYGLSAIQSSLGMLTQLNNSTNQMLDGIELAVNPMWTYINDGTLEPNNLYYEPGKFIPVQDHNAIQPMAPPPNNFSLSFQQLAFLESSIDKNAGVGPLVGVGQPRGGERVTAAEINAVIEAGGNRLLGVYNNIQDTALIPIMQKTLSNIRQFTKTDETIPVPLRSGNGTMYVDVGPPELEPEYDIVPRGSEHIVEREEHIMRLEKIFTMALQLPEQLQGQVDLVKLWTTIVSTVLFEDPEEFLMQQEELPMEEPTAPPPTPHMQQAMLTQLMADGGQSMMSRIMGDDADYGNAIAAVGQSNSQLGPSGAGIESAPIPAGIQPPV